jgi:hypothetical protein
MTNKHKSAARPNFQCLSFTAFGEHIRVSSTISNEFSTKDFRFYNVEIKNRRELNWHLAVASKKEELKYGCINCSAMDFSHAREPSPPDIRFN